MNIWGITDKGMVRKENQDAYAFETVSEPAYSVCVICDGMGGAKAGNIASAIAVEKFMDGIKSGYKENMTASDVGALGSSAVVEANTAVHTRAQEDSSCTGMGTTLVAAVSCGDEIVLFNVGDSRAYKINGNGISAVTKDHSMVQDMIERGDITAEQAKIHPSRNLITRALGTEADVKCDVFTEKLEGGEYLLLCSDGLVNTVTDQEMLYEVLHGGEAETCLERLLEISRKRGAPDNVTAILIRQDEKGA